MKNRHTFEYLDLILEMKYSLIQKEFYISNKMLVKVRHQRLVLVILLNSKYQTNSIDKFKLF